MDKVITDLAHRLVDYLVRVNQVSEEKQELYVYSALVTIQSTINILTTLFLGFVFGEFLENICFFLVYKTLREYSGGLHSSKFSKCFFISVILNIAVLLTFKISEHYPNYLLALIIEVISLIVVIIFAPIANDNKPINETEQRVYKRIVCGVSVIMIGISIVFSLKDCVLVFSISLSMLLNSVLVIIGMLKNKRCFDKFDSV